MTNVGRRRGLACTRRDYDDDTGPANIFAHDSHTHAAHCTARIMRVKCAVMYY